MPRTERVTVKYETSLVDGLRESDSSGKIHGNYEDKPFVIRLNKVTRTEVFDGRGKNWTAGSTHTDVLGEMSLETATDLARTILENLVYAAEVAQRRVLVPEPKQEV